MSFAAISSRCARLASNVFALLFVIGAFAISVCAQSTIDASTPPGQSPGAPAGSFALSGFDNVNLFNGNLNFSLPVTRMGGRGEVGYNVTLTVEQRWVSEAVDSSTWIPTFTWWAPSPGYGPGVLQGRQTSLGCEDTFSYTEGTTRLTFTMPDHTEYELLDTAYGGQPASSYCGGYVYDAWDGSSRGTTFVTRDGTSATFISDQLIKDVKFATSVPYILNPTGYLMLRDGTRYRIVDGAVEWMRDRNGNKLTFSYSSFRLSSVTDSMNRQVTFDYDVQDAQCGTCDRINFKGAGGVSRKIWLVYKNLGQALAPGQSLKTLGGPNGLFPELSGSSSTQYDAGVLASVIMPNLQKYEFYYNSYGELAKVKLPTGGTTVYDWGPGVEGGAASGVTWGSQIYRRVLERRTYTDDATTLASITSFGRIDNIFGPESSAWLKNLSIDGSQTVLSQSKHYFQSGPLDYINHSGGWLPDPLDGREKKTENYNPSGSTVLRRTTHTWATGGSLVGTPINPRITQTVQTIEPATANLVNKQTFSYDSYNNQTDVYEYGFGVGTAGALVRRTHSDYLTTNSVNGINYATTSTIHIRSLIKQQEVFDSGGIRRAFTVYEYDNYATDANHAALTNRSNISGLDSSFTTAYGTRGNSTAVTRHLLNSSGVSTGSTAVYQQYDIAGSAVKTIDARGSATVFDFADRFGTPDGNAQANSGATELGSQVSYAFPAKVTNASGHIAYVQFDYYLGQAVDSEDANGAISSLYRNDSLDRVTQVRRAVATGVTNQTTFAYDDTNRVITTTSDLTAFNDNILVSKTIHDGLGRVRELRQYEGGGNYIATQTAYDAFGRPFKTSYPFRPWQSQTAVWTTQVFDALGRVISVTTPDNAVVSTSYSGNTTTVTDQAGKARKSVGDALGRLIEVYEDPNGLNYQTTYLYDVLDDLVKVTQGSQQRYFMYDSLKRLIRVRNPEQSTNAGLALSDPITGNSAWSVGYQYDANGNLTQKTDPRGVTSTYVYDALNRNTTIDYSDTASINPDVKWFYDGATNGKGRFWYFYKGGDLSTGSNVDHKAIDSYDALGRPLVQRQLFKLNGTWSPTYQITRDYNRAGAVISQTYPSGHAVSYAYDAAGRSATFSGNLGDGTTRTYSSNASYSPFGGLSKEQFGTSTATYHKAFYNIRGQLFDTRVSSVNDTWDWNRGRLIRYYSSNHLWGQSGTDNNDNVLFAENWIPPDNATLDQADTVMEDSYTYDSLNRLSSVTEQRMTAAGGWVWSQQFQQSYTYDRWGNRTINPASWGTGINERQFTVDTATNRLGVPVGQTGVMSYDNAGNLTSDTYTGAGNRTYDAGNKMLTAVDNTGQTSRYTYDADGNRTRRQVASSQEEWQIYGIDSELVAEYRASSPATAPEKEYGYRNGQLLITATGRYNVALAANGAVATASSTATGSGFSTIFAINGNYRGPWGNSVEGWNDNTPNVVPDWLQVDFAGSKTIDEISVFSLHDNYTIENTPTETQTFTLYGLQAFNVQYWNGSSWVTIPNGSVTGNNKVWRKFTFSPITTSKIRLTINQVPDSWSRVVEIQAFGTSAGGEKVQWLIPDHLGTPRIILDQAGSFANVRRHDYLPFGEELIAGMGGRTVAQGYAGDGVRQQFTSKERDTETGLDYFCARYYANIQGRFTSADEPFADQSADNPQSWNLYSYVRNNPLIFIDPTGRFGDYYNRDGSYAYTDNINDNRVYVLNETREADGSINLIPQLLPMTHTEFQRSANIVRHEGGTDDADEYSWIAHASYNEANLTHTTLYALLQTGFSSAPASIKNNGIATTDDSIRANAARAGVLDAVSGGTDPTGGARRWDGTDFLAWGLNGPFGSHAKFREFASIHISGQNFSAYENAQIARWGNSVSYYGTRYTIPAAVFTNAANWTQNRDFHYVTNARNQTRNLVATGVKGQSIFWTF